MANSHVLIGLFLLAVAAISRVQSTCVFESDYGFKLNCAFKKSSLFRVRNLGGIKAHVGLGFSVGDELGFDQSISNLDTSKRRSVGFQNGSPYNSLNSNPQQQQKTTRTNKNRLTVIQPSTSTSSSNSEAMLMTEKPMQSGRSQSSIRQMAMPKAGIPAFKPIPPAQEMVAPSPTLRSPYPMMPQSQKTVQVNRMGQTPNSNFVNLSVAPLRVAGSGQGGSNEAIRTIPAPVMSQIPKFSSMPASISRVSTMEDLQKQQGISVVSSQAYKNGVQIPMAPTMNGRVPNFGYQSLSLNKVQPSPIYSQIQDLTRPAQKVDNMITYNYVSGQDYAAQNSLQQKIAALSKATNISMETIEAAVRLRQNQILQQMLNSPPVSVKPTRAPTTTTTTTRRPAILPTLPPKRYQTPAPASNPPSKVMNAPKEYYPVGYDKNFDDNFISKVDLPETTFYCGDQKHFPGLYGDEDLGCMVFHVCALTDDGLIMKSFLCPESTLFDQTILKCNWWFYVDCKSSKKLYDSNIPISKSYQLMKALTFFSSYKKEIQGDDQNVNESVIEENTDGVNNAVKILQNQANMQLPKVEIVELNKTNQGVRNSKYFTPVSAREVNSLITSSEKDVTSAEINDKPADTSSEVVSPEPSSTSTSVQTSSSVERKYRRRRPSVSWKIAPSTSTTSSTESPTTDSKNRIERSSAEVTESSSEIRSTIVVLDEKGSQSTKIIHPDASADSMKTIEMMDEAIIGHT